MFKMRWLLVTFVLMVAMTSYLGSYAIASEPVSAVKKDTVYSNESFSIMIPKGWEGNDSLWSGPVSSFHEMDIYNKFDEGAWVSIVRYSTKPFNWESPKQSAELSTALKELPPDEALKYNIEPDPNYLGVVGVQDSIEIGGCPAYLTVYKYQAEEDTLLNFQFCVITPWNNQLYYVNHSIYYSTMSINPQIGDECYKIIESIKFEH